MISFTRLWAKATRTCLFLCVNACDRYSHSERAAAAATTITKTKCHSSYYSEHEIHTKSVRGIDF